uniref:Insulin-like androgenic gland specific factor n=1 Tax=Sagmariasus verreauxi TaxID=1412110 RepID=A0A075DZ23_9EUCA|nr:insulin-like androgenic gland specific factor [Sagmariasus verreauxi]
MLAPILLKLVVLAGMRQLPAASYNVSGLSEDFECGDFENVLGRICAETQSNIVRDTRSVSTVAVADSTHGGTDPSRRPYHHPRAIQVVLRHAANPPATQGAGAEEGVRVTSEAAFSLVKSRSIRDTRETNLQDECCPFPLVRHCDKEEILHYCFLTEG